MVADLFLDSSEKIRERYIKPILFGSMSGLNLEE